MNKNIVKMAVLIFSAFAVVILYQTYIQVFQGNYLLNHPRNRRLQVLEEAVTRGSILDRNGRVLAKTEGVDKAKKRIYPYGEVTSNITGYLSRRYGRCGLESTYNQSLLGLSGGLSGGDFWSLQRVSSGQRGNDIILSLDASLQEQAYRLLGSRKGAVIAIEPSTGRVLAMVSRPGFDPKGVDSNWETLKVNPDSPLLNRATQGLYPPGSTMKVVTAAGILGIQPATVGRVFEAPGFITVEGMRIEDKQAIGRMNFIQAFARSSNYVFATLGIEQGVTVLFDTARKFGIGRNIPFDITTGEGDLPDPLGISKLELAESAIGQGRVMVTPLNMVLIAAGLANGGQVMTPTLVDEIRDASGSVISRSQPKLMFTAVTKSVADTLVKLMTAVVSGGTGVEATISGIQVAGKTGSAQNPHGQPHAWFIGFAPAGKPKVAVAVIIENGGPGGREAAPVAREIMKTVIGTKR